VARESAIVNTVWELFVIEDCNTDGVVGNKECEILSGLVCNPNKYRHHGTILSFNILSRIVSGL
jgi:hypothetical protein